MSSSLSFLATTASPFHHHHSRHPRKASRAPTHFSPSASGPSTNATNNKAFDNGGDKESILRLDRRNVLLGTLGGLCGAATLGRKNTAFAAPLQPPDLSKCQTANAGSEEDPLPVECCPPYTDNSKIVDYKFPSPSTPLRIRKPAHLLNADDLAKYKEAYRLMKALDPSDPWSFEQQARVHCQYCNGAYDQVGFDVPVNVHFNWIFEPWHRYYLHFHERILGKLIGDETLALPFWNWDSPDGMTIPSIFNDTKSPLYNEKRNQNNLTKVMDYHYSTQNYEDKYTEEELKLKNLYEMNTTYRESLPLPELFHGDPVRAGEEASIGKTMGRIEAIHNAGHSFVGMAKAPYRDMGNLASSGYDPLFYCHHSNVDRMWHIYRQMRGNKVDFNDNDWLKSSFVFYDENRQLVRVQVEDCLNPQKLRYTYQEVELPWADRNMIKKKLVKTKSGVKPRSTTSLVQVSEFGPDPRPLDSTIRALVQRPKKSRTKSEKDDEVEVLVIDGIELPPNGPISFEVYVAAPSGGDFVGPDLGESAGRFSKLPHTHIHKKGNAEKKKCSLKLGISKLLEEIDAEGSEKVVVSLVPKDGEVTIGGIHIDLIKTDWRA
ncbi:polyphenol oxidase, chloroplastic-like [Magnolia sinica]|uniref:polyphenol oxidase, chloroplastic-like n=1 Tax=Magnolia sinica TaxID=86752 RepID=UPI0026582353|nr:polyphenol oxidase, chloroplastic-like [Magnolia sinica]